MANFLFSSLVLVQLELCRVNKLFVRLFLPEQAWQITGAFGIWGIAAAEDSIWVAGQISSTGSNGRTMDGLARFPAL